MVATYPDLGGSGRNILILSRNVCNIGRRRRPGMFKQSPRENLSGEKKTTRAQIFRHFSNKALSSSPLSFSEIHYMKVYLGELFIL